MDDGDPSSVRLAEFPAPAESLGTDVNGNVVDTSNRKVGGDLSGTLPNPLVKQITGVGAEVTASIAPFTWEPSSHSAPNGGRGIGFGKIFKNGVEVDAWLSIGEKGEHWVTTNEWKTATRSAYTMSARRWGESKFVHNASIGKDMWIFGWDGTGYAYVPHEAASYETDGTLKLSAWRVTGDGSLFYGVTATGATDTLLESRPVYVTDLWGNPSSFSAVIPNIGDITKNKNTGTIMWVGYAHEVVRTQDFQHFSIVLQRSPTQTDIGNGIYYPTGAISCDQYGNWIVMERESGTLWINNHDGEAGNVGNGYLDYWRILDSITLDDVVVTNKRLNQSGHNETWANMVAAYGRWIFCQDLEFVNPHYGPAFIYTDDLINFYSYTSNANVYSFYSCDTDGIKFFATNSKASVSPAVYRLLVNEVPVHRMLVCEKGIQIAGDAFLSDLKNATSIGTDENGKMVAKYDTTSPSKKYYTTAPDLVRGDSSEVMAVSATFNGIDTVGWAVNEIVELEFHLMMPPLELNGSLTSGGSKVVNVAGPPRQVFFLFENTALNTAGIFQVQGLMNDRPYAGTSVVKTSKRPYKVILELEKVANDIIVRGGTVSVPYYVSGSVETEGILSFGYVYDNLLGKLFRPSAVPGNNLVGEFDHLTIGLNLDWLGELALTGCEVFSSAFIADDSLTAVLEVNRLKKGA